MRKSVEKMKTNEKMMSFYYDKYSVTEDDFNQFRPMEEEQR